MCVRNNEWCACCATTFDDDDDVEHSLADLGLKLAWLVHACSARALLGDGGAAARVGGEWSR